MKKKNTVCYSTNTLAIKRRRIPVDAGFILVLPLHHGDLELDSVGVSTKNHVAICEIKIPVQEL